MEHRAEMSDTPPTPENAPEFPEQAIADTLAQMPPPLQAFVLEHLPAISVADRLRAAHTAYVLSFLEGARALFHGS